MTISEMRRVLAADDIRLTKSLGQNFLHDAHQLRRIADAAELTASDKVLEIGPGLGPLTELLVAQAGEGSFLVSRVYETFHYFSVGF